MNRLSFHPLAQHEVLSALQKKANMVFVTCAFIGLLLTNALIAEVKAEELVSEQRASELEHMLRHDCGSCHGMSLKGGLGPSLRLEQLNGKPKEYIKYTILHGRPDTAMPPWNAIISDADAEWLANYLISGKQEQD